MNILIITGERSAENYASILVDELFKIDRGIKFFSICSDILDKKTKKIADYRDVSIIGIKEALSVTNKVLKLFQHTKKAIKDNKIDMVVLMDFPEFNMRVAKFAKSLGKKIVYYISPQVWAWRAYRIKALFRYSDFVIPILPFEKTFFNVKGVDKSKLAYFGHPLVDLLHGKIENDQKREKIVLIMPGSRKTEIEYNYRVMFDAANILKDRLKGFRFVWALPKNIDFNYAKKLLYGFDFIEVENDSHALMKKAYLGILKSGTTTLEAAMFSLPMVVVYKLSLLSYLLGRLLIKNIRYISLPNIIAGREIVKELIEHKATSENIVRECLKLHDNPALYEDVKNQLKGVSCVLGEYPVTKKIAQKIYSLT